MQTTLVVCVMGGLGIGMSTVAAPLYIAEIAPPKYRGRLTGLFQFNIVFGIVVAYASNALLAIGQGVTIWVYIAEIFPNQYRARGQALGSFTHWMFAALLTSVFPLAVTAFAPATVFAFFAFMMLLQLIWVQTLMVETKGVPLEQIAERLGVPRHLLSTG
jgi:MFS transporter, SP family, arabinose:H+ symporter